LGSIVGGVGSAVMGLLVNVYGVLSTTEWGLIMGYGSLFMVFITLITWKGVRSKL